MCSFSHPERTYSKPSILVTPSGVVPVGTNITITCKRDQQVLANFFFWKKGSWTQEYEPTSMKENTFSISNAEPSDGQIYFCAYCFQGDKIPDCSSYSNEVNVTLRDPSLSEPAILVKPSKDIYPGTKVSFYCQGPETGLTYSLWRAQVLAGTRMAEPDSQIVEFPLFKVKTEDTGNYSCHYQLKGNPFVWSLQSDSIKMIVNGE
ncbi:hypothetical protein lerEdw1_015854 [Lerista edwardsae]|nr:hypothetical protein lerEdw1_015854 [Lerista edwardsae]